MRTDCNSHWITFTPLQRRELRAGFDGGKISSDAEVLLLREVTGKSKLFQRMAPAVGFVPHVCRHRGRNHNSFTSGAVQAECSSQHHHKHAVEREDAVCLTLTNMTDGVKMP